MSANGLSQTNLPRTDLIVWDLEFTSWEGAQARDWSGPGEEKEIVQIGAVRLSPTFEEIAAFDLLVLLRLNPILSDYFKALTGLSQERLEADGVSWPEALSRFSAFCHGAGLILANGSDGEVLERNCDLWHMPSLIPLERFRSLRPALEAKLGQGVSSGAIAGLLGLDKVGAAHDGLADARNVALALRHYGQDWLVEALS